jgi:hypothetical protein
MANLKFGDVIVQTYGSQLLISDGMLDRLVLGAQCHKVQDVAQIVKETNWKADWAHEFGPSLLLVLFAYFPLPPAPVPVVLDPVPTLAGSMSTISNTDCSCLGLNENDSDVLEKLTRMSI